MRKIAIFGASRGLGNSMIEGLGKKGDSFFLISRTEPLNLTANAPFSKQWIQADLSEMSGVNTVLAAIGNSPIDVLIYNAGIWENKEFTKVSGEEIMRIIQINLTSVILLVQQLIPNIRSGQLKKIIFIGSTCGLENEGSDTVVYTATKFGLRGVAHALRELLRRDGIAVSCISPGSIASDIPYSDGPQPAIEKYSGHRMPVADILSMINMIIETSNASCIKEIHVPALMDTDA